MLALPQPNRSDVRRLVPWVDWHEWRRVQAQLFSDSPSEAQAALTRVGVWRARGNVPAAVDATASLVGTVFLDSTCARPPLGALAANGRASTIDRIASLSRPPVLLLTLLIHPRSSLRSPHQSCKCCMDSRSCDWSTI